MTDPEVLYRQLASGDVGRIMAVIEPISSAMGALERAGSSIESVRVDDWQGTAATGFTTRSTQTGTATSAAHDRLSRAVQVIEAAAGAYGTMRGAADNAIRAWRSRPPGDQPGLAAQVTEALSTVRDGYERTLRAYAGVLADLKPAFAETAAGSAAWEATALRPGLTVPAPGTDPKAVAQWWAGLSETERDQLLATRFDDLGRLRGLPAPVLDDANQRRIEVDQARFGAQGADLDARIAQRAAELGIDPSDESALRSDPALADLLDARQDNDRLLTNAAAAEERVAEADSLSADQVYVLSYDPVGPGSQDGTLAIAYGNPDEADNLAVVVPGAGTTLDTGYPNGHAAELRAEMDAAEPGSNNVTIAWLGYDAPEFSDLTVASPDNATEGGALLVSDVEGYRAAGDDPHVTVLGHSYGSTTVGYAAMNGLAADDIAFLGSPGVGASNVDQLSPGAGHVWAGATEHDPVVQGTSGDWFTADGSSTGPYDSSFGANQFGASSDANLATAHSEYYTPDSESVRNLANIATGNYSAVSEPNVLDHPLPPEVPGSDLPVVGPVIDGAVNIGKEAIDLVADAGGGLWDAGSEAVSGDWDAAWDELKETGGEVLNDGADVIIGGVGDVAEGVRDVYENTLGRIF